MIGVENSGLVRMDHGVILPLLFTILSALIPTGARTQCSLFGFCNRTFPLPIISIQEMRFALH